MPGRIACLDLHPDDAFAFFKNNVLAATPTIGLFEYSNTSFKRRPTWAEMVVPSGNTPTSGTGAQKQNNLHKFCHTLITVPPVCAKVHRTALSDIFELSHGQLVRQKVLQAQLSLFYIKIKRTIPFEDAEGAVWRLRIMMSQLRQIKHDEQEPPAGFECMKSVLSKIALDGPSGGADRLADKATNPSDAVDGSCVSLLDDAQQRPGSPDIVVEISDADTDMHLDDLFCPADTPVKAKANPPLETPPKAAKPVLTGFDEIDKLIDDLADAPGPTSREYKATFKRPASKTSKTTKLKKTSAACTALVDASSDSVSAIAPADLKNRLHKTYSSVYHAERSRLSKSSKLPDGAIRKLACAKARAARLALRKKYA